MGTNYYVVRNRPTTQSPVHIGKSSVGWFFNFQTQNERWYDPPIVWNTFNQVKDWLKKYTVDSKEYVIIDEYDRIISLNEFVEMVERKQNDPHARANPDNFAYDVKNIDGYRFSDRDFC